MKGTSNVSAALVVSLLLLLPDHKSIASSASLKTSHVLTELRPVANVSIKEALSVCNQLLQTLPVPQSLKEQHKVEKALRGRSINSAWLNVKWRQFGHWVYLNGTPFVGLGKGPLGTNAAAQCAALRKNGDLYIYKRDCYTKQDGYICQRKGKPCKACPLPRSCRVLSAGQGCVLFSSEGVSWFHADQTCRKFGGTLLMNLDIVKDLPVNKSMPSYFWVGLVRGAWYKNDQATASVKSRLRWKNWQDRIRHDEDKSCAVMDVSDGRWEPVKCNESHSFICVHDKRRSDSNGPGASVAVVTLSVLCIVTGIIIPCVILSRHVMSPRFRRWIGRYARRLEGVRGRLRVQFSIENEQAVSKPEAYTENQPLDTKDEVLYDTPVNAVIPGSPCNPAPVLQVPLEESGS